MEQSFISNGDRSAKVISPVATEQKLWVSPTTQRSSVVGLIFALLRGPMLWLCGVSLLSGVFISLWEYIPHKAVIPLALLVALGTVMLWTLLCCSVFGNDIYTRIVQPLVLKPVLLNATQYSMDDILRTICDPTQLATFLSACWMVPFTLYSVPTTEHQRAQVLSAAGILPPAATVDRTDPEVSQIFTQPGGWISLLPEWFQKIAQPMISDIDENSGSVEYCTASATLLRKSKTMHGTLHPQDVTIASTVDEEDSDDDFREAATSPLHEANPTYPKKHESNFSENVKRTPRVSSEMESSKLHVAPELSELFLQIWLEMIQSKWDRICRRLREQRSNMAITAMVTCTVLWLQLRYSPTARKMIRNVAHMLLTTSAGVAFLGSTVALLSPYLYQTWLKNQDQTASRGPNDIFSESKHLSVLLSSLLSSLKTAIPLSMPSTKEIAKKMQRFIRRWKGAVAVFVLAYFRYQFQKRKLRKSVP
jgi:hypothetical protein